MSLVWNGGCVLVLGFVWGFLGCFSPQKPQPHLPGACGGSRNGTDSAAHPCQLPPPPHQGLRPSKGTFLPPSLPSSTLSWAPSSPGPGSPCLYLRIPSQGLQLPLGQQSRELSWLVGPAGRPCGRCGAGAGASGCGGPRRVGRGRTGVTHPRGRAASACLPWVLYSLL